MKRLALTVAALVLAAGTLAAQSLMENSYYRESVRLKALATEAFEDGDYDAAADYAAQSQEYAILSDEYVARMLDMKSAQDSIKAAQARYDWAIGINAPKRYPDAFETAQQALSDARTAMEANDYQAARDGARLVLDSLAGLSEVPALPAYFIVRDIPGWEDCLWRIAELPAVYNSPWFWTGLYRANKAKLPNPNNPDLIEPGMILEIPSIAGEYREGTWQPGVDYPVFSK